MNNETGSVFTDPSGFTWVSTQSGMQRFNGYRMENINPVVNGDTIIIDHPVIFFPLNNGRVWISYKEGILEYDFSRHLFRKVITLAGYPRSYLPVIPLLQKKGEIWCMYAKKGIVVYNDNGKFSQPIGNAASSFVDNILLGGNFLSTKITATNGNDIFLSDGKQLLQINTKILTENYLQTGLSDIYNLACSRNNLYIISQTGLTSVDILSGYMLRHVALSDITTESFYSGQVCVNNNNKLLVSFNRHLYEFDPACNYQKEFTSLTGNPILTAGYISYIYSDRFRRIWLMTNDDIKLVQDVEVPFSHYIYPNAKSNFIKCIYYDEQKKQVLAGCFNGGIQLYDSTGNPLWQKPVLTNIAKDIIVIEKLTPDDFLIETYYRGWFLLNLPSKKIVSFPVPDSIEKLVHSNRVTWTNNSKRLNDSTILIATESNVFNCSFKNTVIRSAKPLLPFSPNKKELIDCFIYTTNKTLWAGTSLGLLYVLDKNGNLKTINTPGDFGIRSCAEDINHNIWIGADKGLYVYNDSGKLIKRITRETGLLNDCIYALLPMNDQPAVFASTNFGLSYVSVDGIIKNYTKEFGLQENEFNNGAAYKTANGKFYFGGINGITAFFPGALSAAKDTPVINITRFVVNDSLYNSFGSSWGRDSVLLHYDQNHIQLDIAANGLLNTNEYIYTYRLKGLEESWQTTHRPTEIRYTLDPGTYTLQINCSPYLSSNLLFHKSIVIIISPPWWKTWWFRLFTFICVTFLIVLIVWQYSRRAYLKKIRALQVQQEVQQERERISRDLHDNLGAYVAAIAANVTRVQETHEVFEKETSQALTELQNNSESIITQLHDTIWALNREAIALTSISDRFKIFIQKIRPTYPSIDINVKESITTDTALSPAHALHLFRIMQEGVNNAVRHSNCKNIVVFIESNSGWVISIIDDGTGINDTIKSNPGNGLRNMRQRATEAGWNIKWVNETKGTRLKIISTH